MLHLSYSCPVSSFRAQLSYRATKEKAMRKVLLLALVTMLFATACSKSEETAPAPDAAASASAPADAGSPAVASSPADASSPAGAASPAAPQLTSFPERVSARPTE